MDKALFVDTGFLIALAAPRDRLHAKATALAAEVQRYAVQLITTRAILLELGAALSDLPYRVTANRVLSALETDPAIDIQPIEPLYSSALEMFIKHVDKEWSLTDCLSFVAMRNRNIQSALSADKHFEQAGFAALLRME